MSLIPRSGSKIDPDYKAVNIVLDTIYAPAGHSCVWNQKFTAESNFAITNTVSGKSPYLNFAFFPAGKANLNGVWVNVVTPHYVGRYDFATSLEDVNPAPDVVLEELFLQAV